MGGSGGFCFRLGKNKSLDIVQGTERVRVIHVDIKDAWDNSQKWASMAKSFIYEEWSRGSRRWVSGSIEEVKVGLLDDRVPREEGLLQDTGRAKV